MFKILLHIAASLLLLFTPSEGHGQQVHSYAQETGLMGFPNHSQARLISSHTRVRPGQEILVGLHIVLDPEWHTYWSNPGDSGAAALIEQSVEPPLAVEHSEILWPIPMRIETPPLMTYGYENEVLLSSTVKISEQLAPDTKEILLSWDVEWLVCKVECIPAFHTFEWVLEVSSEEPKESAFFEFLNSPSFQSLPQMPPIKGVYAENSGAMKITVDHDSDQKFLDFFPDSNLKVASSKPTSVDQMASTFSFNMELKSSLEGENLSGLLLFEDPTNPRQPVGREVILSLEGGTPLGRLWAYMLGAFLGGLILNLMPCVFPIISLKVFSALQGKDRSTQRTSHFMFVLGSLVSFLVFALTLLAFKSMGQSLGWGFQLQSPGFLLFLIFLFFILSLNFLGLFEIKIPGMSVAGPGTSPWSSFASGVLAVLVASPCTAPFMGAAMGFALYQSTPVLLLIFLGLGLGFSSPYILLGAYPQILSKVPKSGPWLGVFKEFMFFPMVLTALWLLWIFSQIQGATAAAWVAASLIGLGALFWWRRQPLGKTSRIMGQLALLIFALSTFWQALLTTPPQTSHPSTSLVDWIGFDPNHIQSLRENGEDLFIDFTADWCITCKVNERVTFTNRDVLEFIQAENIHMMKADWTRRDPQITQFLEQYQRISVPFYLFWSEGRSEPLILPELLTPQIFMNQIQHYKNRN